MLEILIYCLCQDIICHWLCQDIITHKYTAMYLILTLFDDWILCYKITDVGRLTFVPSAKENNKYK